MHGADHADSWQPPTHAPCCNIQQQFEQLAQQIPYQTLVLPAEVQRIQPALKIDIKRLDAVHAQISGNKFFKLKYNLIEARRLGYHQLLSFGGAYSNHIAALAFAAQQFGFQSHGIIRGEELAQHPLNATLHVAQQHGMQLEFVSRQRYRALQQPEALAQLQHDYPEHYILPEGGSNALAIQGCQEIITDADRAAYDLICVAVGTGSTIAGIIQASAVTQQLLGFSALRGDFLNSQVQALTTRQNWRITDDYCFGGYAKSSPKLLSFMQDFETTQRIPLEPIYTAKMLYGIFDLIQQGYFEDRPRVLVIHTGGLQGRSEYHTP